MQDFGRLNASLEGAELFAPLTAAFLFQCSLL